MISLTLSFQNTAISYTFWWTLNMQFHNLLLCYWRLQRMWHWLDWSRHTNVGCIIILNHLINYQTALFWSAMYLNKSTSDLGQPQWLMGDVLYMHISLDEYDRVSLLTWIWNISPIVSSVFYKISTLYYAKCLSIINSLWGHIAFRMPVSHSPTLSRLTDRAEAVWF